MEPCGTSTFKNETCMRNLAEPGPRFRAAAPNHPEALLEEPQAFQAVGGKSHWMNLEHAFSKWRCFKMCICHVIAFSELV